jgi:hypothetical protein
MGCGIRTAEIKDPTIDLRCIIAETTINELRVYGFDGRVTHALGKPVQWVICTLLRALRSARSRVQIGKMRTACPCGGLR